MKGLPSYCRGGLARLRVLLYASPFGWAGRGLTSPAPPAHEGRFNEGTVLMDAS